MRRGIAIAATRTTSRLLCRRLASSIVHTPVETAAADVHPPFARYVHACAVPPDSQLIVTSGQLGIETDGSIPDGAEAQTALALRNVASVLAQSGAGLQHVVRLNAYVTGREHLPGYMKARDAALGALPPTASTLVVVSGFARPEFVVEVEAMAAVAAAPPPPGTRAAAKIAAAAAGRRGVHTSASRHFRRHQHGARVAPEAVAAFVDAVRGAGVRVLASADGDDARREVTRRSRDFYWCSPAPITLLH